MRKNLKCKDFKWFLENVIPEKFIIDENVFAFGEARNIQSQLCLDTLGKDEKKPIDLGVFFCQNRQSSNQVCLYNWLNNKNKSFYSISIVKVFSFSKNFELRREDLCCTGGTEGTKVGMYDCTSSSNQKWQHKKGGPIVHVNTGLCLDVTKIKSGDLPVLNECNPNRLGQNWEFASYL